MLNYYGFERLLDKYGMQEWAEQAEAKSNDYFTNIKHGDYPHWCEAIEQLPDLKIASFDFLSDAVQLVSREKVTEEKKSQLDASLKKLMPWRKGPFDLFNIHVDTEWRSDMKWSRIQGKISPLKNRTILDIGCGNGYYGWRMLGEGASIVVGADPTLRFAMQFHLLKHYLPEQPFYFLPFAIQDMDASGTHFDTVFSMGVIYHRRDPVEHCQQLYQFLRPGGELVLESLIVEDKETLVPKDRYAKMNNVWHVPNTQTLLHWLEQAGFKNSRVVNISKTTIEEQRRTEWMVFESLSDFLDKEDNSKTVEGYPAPVRAIVIANRP